MALGGVGVREPAIPGAAIRARAAVSAAPATNRLGRTMLGRYDDSRLPATSPGCRARTTLAALPAALLAHAPAGALAPVLAGALPASPRRDHSRRARRPGKYDAA